MSNEIRIIGGGEVGQRIADRLSQRGDSVCLIEKDEERSQTLESEGYSVFHGDGTDLTVLQEAAIGKADVVVVATGDDDSNLLAAQLIRSRFDPESVIAKVNQPENEEPFAELGINTVSRPDAVGKMFDSHIESPALTRWMETVGEHGDVQEVAVENPTFVGSTMRELDEHLPEQVLMVMVGEEADAHLPDREETLENGDHVTLIGDREKVRKAMALLSDSESVPSERQ